MDAAITRVGVLDYQDQDGKTWREFKPESEVFRPDSLATLEGAPGTELHPDVAVSASNWSALAVGHLVGTPRREDGFVVAPVAVQRADVASRVESGELHDVSAGYTCRVEWTAGEWNGQRYDAVQRDIVYNHFALGPRGWGRAGEDVCVRLNGAAVQVRGDAAPKGNENAMKVLKIRGREYKLDAESEAAAAQGAVGDMEKKSDADAAELSAVKEALMNALTLVAQLEAKLAAANAATPAPVTEASVPDEVADAIASKRIVLRERARRVLGAEAKLDGKSTKELHREVVARAMPTVKLDGLTDATVEGMFLAVTSDGATARNDALGAAHKAAHPSGERTDGADDEDLDPRAALAQRTHRHFEHRASGESETDR